jgi:hypothetical protein
VFLTRLFRDSKKNTSLNILFKLMSSQCVNQLKGFA